MNRIIVFDKSMPQIGLFSRTVTPGDEYNMVLDFISFYCKKFLRDNQRNNLAVFIEPKVASGFPDVVFASYSPSIIDTWTEQRKKINVSDLKILFCLLQTSGMKGESIISLLKMPEKQTLCSLEKLLDANLITYKRNLWRPSNLHFIFSIKKLVSVEAKVSDISKVVEQSFINTWFASHSYALISASRPQSETIKTFSQCGIGLYCIDKNFKKIIDAQPLGLPLSYQSLLFNEWIGNRLVM